MTLITFILGIIFSISIYGVFVLKENTKKYKETLLSLSIVEKEIESWHSKNSHLKEKYQALFEEFRDINSKLAVNSQSSNIDPNPGLEQFENKVSHHFSSIENRFSSIDEYWKSTHNKFEHLKNRVDIIENALPFYI
jgi:predicted  nucleic acid-binding Zn-ribbon protein